MIDWIEVTVKTPSEAVEAVSNRLFELGSSGVITEDTLSDKIDYGFNSVKGYFPDDDRFSPTFFKISSYLDLLKELGFNIGSDRITIEKIKEEAAENWRQHFKTIAIGRNIVIKPPWEVFENRENKICIEINPARAFGTGGHPTTKLCLIFLEEICSSKEEEISSMLDVGCGSGILAIAAKKLDVKRVVGLDTDSIAIEESNKNAELNNLKDRVLFSEEKFENLKECFSIIAANIYSGPLCRMMPVFKKKLLSDGKLITSGIMNDQEAIVLDFAKENGFTLKKKMREENWSAFLFTS